MVRSIIIIAECVVSTLAATNLPLTQACCVSHLAGKRAKVSTRILSSKYDQYSSLSAADKTLFQHFMRTDLHEQLTAVSKMDAVFTQCFNADQVHYIWNRRIKTEIGNGKGRENWPGTPEA